MMPGHHSWGYCVAVGEPANAESPYLCGPYYHSSPYPSSAQDDTACMQRGHLTVDLLLGTIWASHAAGDGVLHSPGADTAGFAWPAWRRRHRWVSPGLCQSAHRRAPAPATLHHPAH